MYNIYMSFIFITFLFARNTINYHTDQRSLLPATTTGGPIPGASAIIGILLLSAVSQDEDAMGGASKVGDTAPALARAAGVTSFAEKTGSFTAVMGAGAIIRPGTAGVLSGKVATLSVNVGEAGETGFSRTARGCGITGPVAGSVRTSTAAWVCGKGSGNTVGLNAATPGGSA